jgi:acetoin utilization deacetylase AcuC-like enzyme
LSIGKDGEQLRVFYSDRFTFPLPGDHRFPISKYERLRKQALERGVLTQPELEVSEAATDEQIGYAHHPSYLEKLNQGTLSEREIRRIGFPWSAELLERSRRSVGGTINACQAAIKDGIGINLAGGTHHAHATYGSGYCLLNDCAIAARVVQLEDHFQRVIILDCDVHQGDGTAAIFSSDRSVFTFSIHGERNFPFRKVPSDLDLPLEDKTGDEEYLQTLDAGLKEAFDIFQADLAIYLAGADPFVDDRLGRLSLSKSGLAERDQLVLSYCKEAGLPITIVMAGGYARDINDTVDIHLNTVRLAAEVVTSNPIGTRVH